MTEKKWSRQYPKAKVVYISRRTIHHEQVVVKLEEWYDLNIFNYYEDAPDGKSWCVAQELSNFVLYKRSFHLKAGASDFLDRLYHTYLKSKKRAEYMEKYKKLHETCEICETCFSQHLKLLEDNFPKRKGGSE